MGKYKAIFKLNDNLLYTHGSITLYGIISRYQW